jgi:5'-3' exonuclease
MFNGTMLHNGNTVCAVEIIDLYQILMGLDVSFSQFVDICIMCGCDYNSRIGYVGPTRIYPMITKYGSIEAIPNADINRYFKTHVKMMRKKYGSIGAIPPDIIPIEVIDRSIANMYGDDYFINNFTANPKIILNVDSCRRRFAPISVMELLSELDREIDVLNNLTVNRELGPESADFLSGYGLENWLNTFISLYGLFPKIGTRDALPTTPPDIVNAGWTKFMVGTCYLDIFGV